MASLGDWTSAAGPALAQGTRDLMSLGQMVEQRRRNQALEQAASKHLEIAQEREAREGKAAEVDLATQKFKLRQAEEEETRLNTRRPIESSRFYNALTQEGKEAFKDIATKMDYLKDGKISEKEGTLVVEAIVKSPELMKAVMYPKVQEHYNNWQAAEKKYNDALAGGEADPKKLEKLNTAKEATYKNYARAQAAYDGHTSQLAASEERTEAMKAMASERAQTQKDIEASKEKARKELEDLQSKHKAALEALKQKGRGTTGGAPKIGSAVEAIKWKMMSGESLNPGEQKVWDSYTKDQQNKFKLAASMAKSNMNFQMAETPQDQIKIFDGIVEELDKYMPKSTETKKPDFAKTWWMKRAKQLNPGAPQELLDKKYEQLMGPQRLP